MITFYYILCSFSINQKFDCDQLLQQFCVHSIIATNDSTAKIITTVLCIGHKETEGKMVEMMKAETQRRCFSVRDEVI